MKWNLIRTAPMVLDLSRQQLRACRHLGEFARAYNSSTYTSSRPFTKTQRAAATTKSRINRIQASRSTSTATSPSSPKPRRLLRPYVWASLFLLTGVTASAVMRAVVFPPPLPEPNSDEDEYLLSRIRADLNNLPILVELRKDRETWREYDPCGQGETYEFADAHGGSQGGQHLTAATLRGSRGLAVQRAFYNSAEKREISIVFFGGALSGWPGITHGGMLMTVLQDAVERAANGPAFASREATATSDTNRLPAGESSSRRPRLECASLTLTYKKPTRANNFFVIRAEVEESPENSDVVEVKATLEDAVTGVVNVQATASCRKPDKVGMVTESVKDEASSLWSSIGGLFRGPAPSGVVPA